MQLIPRLIVGALLAVAAAAGSLEERADLTSSYQKCYTELTSKSVPNVPTSTVTARQWTRTKVLTTYTWSTVTLTPPGLRTTTVTTTVTRTSTRTASTPTNISTATTTILVTATETAPIVTSSETEEAVTTTVIGVTATIEPPAGFLPIQSTLPGSHDVAATRRREAFEARQHVRDVLSQRASGPKALCTGPVPKYPKSVTCRIFLTVTVVRTVTKTLPPRTKWGTIRTTTITRTATVTTVTTVLPSAAITITTTTQTATTTSTTTPSTTVTVTTTTTATSTNIVATAIPQCDSNLAAFGSQGALYAVDDNDGFIVSTPASSGRECCEACAVNPQCSWSGYVLGSGICYLLQRTSCTSAAQYLLGIAQDPSSSEAFFDYSNGNCAQINHYTT